MKLFQALGYEYMLQLDHDMFLVEPVADNLLQALRKDQIEMAWRDFTVDESSNVSWALAELARYHIVANRINPTQLYQHCTPPNIMGLFTPGAPGVPEGQGWDLKAIRGFFVIIKVPFWHTRAVQHFVKLVLRSGGHFKYRWNEQQVMSMVWLMFAEKTKQYNFNYRHTKDLPNVISIEICEHQTAFSVPD
jgi:hypothetical protein